MPFIVSWPAVTPKGKVLDDIVSFADPYATFAELAGVKPPEGFKTDGQSFAPQLHGQPGKPRAWAYVQLGAHWYVREPGFKLNEAGHLYDMSDAPFVEKPITPDADTPESKAARQRLAAALAELDPAAGKVDRDGGGGGRAKRPAGGAVPAGSATAVGPWKSGDSLSSEQAPAIGGKPFEISAEIEPAGTEGVIVSQGGGARGYALYLVRGRVTFAVRKGGKLTTIAAEAPLGTGRFKVQASLQTDGALALIVDGKQVAAGQAGGLISQQPRAGLTVGDTGRSAVGDYATPNPFKGKVINVSIKVAGDSEAATVEPQARKKQRQ